MNKLTQKEKKFAKNIAEGKNQTQAALDSYNCKDKDSAAATGSWAIRKPEVQREIERIMDKLEVSDEKIISQMKSGMDANVVETTKDGAKETKIPDHKVRHRYMETALSVKGHHAPKKIESKSLNVDVQVEAMSLDELKLAVSEQLKMLKDGPSE